MTIRGLNPGRDNKLYFSPQRPYRLWDTHLSIQCVPGTLSPAVKRLGHEADRLHTSIAEGKNEESYTYTLHSLYAFMAYIGTALPCLLI